MAARPAKRQRRSTIAISDEEEDDTSNRRISPHSRTRNGETQLSQETRTRTAPKSRQRTVRTTSTSNESSSAQPTSPRKVRKTTHNQNSVVQNNKSLHNFFNRATEEQRWQRRADTPLRESQEDSMVDDIIDDDSLDDAWSAVSSEQASQQSTIRQSKAIVRTRSSDAKQSISISSQKFARGTTSTRLPSTSTGVRISSGVSVTEVASEQKPWADRFGPSGLDELAVHKKKIADVQTWLKDVSIGRIPQRVLVLKGPAGSGKSTTISMIARTLGMEVLSWRNPTVSESVHNDAVQQFADFLDRGGQFEPLSLKSNISAGESQSKFDRQILMVEEFPITTTRSSLAYETFRSTLLQYVSKTTGTSHSGMQGSSPGRQQPVVLVISETLLTSSTSFSDSFTAHRLLGPELSHHPLLTVIEFNRVAPTFIAKAIDLVIKKEARQSKRRRMPGPAILQQLGEVGDIRSAINTLEFLCARGDEASDWSGTVASHPKKNSKANVQLTEIEKNTLQLISLRESTLDMFHATGKIVYNKREDPRVHDSRAEPPPKPPDHLMDLYTPKVSQVDVDSLLNETGTDIQTFISTLHENYVLSCNGDDFVESFDGCAQMLSDSELLNPDSRSLIRAQGSTHSQISHMQNGNFDMLRQDEISFQVASRGLLFSLPFPVSRAAPTGMRKQDAFKMFYPTSLRLWKPAEEIYDLITLIWTNRISRGVTTSVVPKPTEGVASWRLRNNAFGHVSNHDNLQGDNNPSEVFMSRSDLVTDILPYLTMVRAARKEDTQLLRKITQLRGMYIVGDETTDEEQYDGHEMLSATERFQQKVEEAHKMLQSQRPVNTGLAKTARAGSTTEMDMKGSSTDIEQEKLYISDDDIQDD